MYYLGLDTKIGNTNKHTIFDEWINILEAPTHNTSERIVATDSSIPYDS